jgi:16S rRNA (guanine527-N7)-methyltransferase
VSVKEQTNWATLKDSMMTVGQSMGLVIAAEQADKLIDYLSELLRWNKAYNLTAITDPHDMLVKHIFDTFAVAPYITGRTILDVGTGAGIPGLILSILFPDKQFTLLDSNGKKTRFLVNMKGKLSLPNVTIVHSRVEQFSTNEGYDQIIARAVASIADIVRACDHLLAPTGQYCLMKGHFPTEELKEIGPAFIVENVQLHVPQLQAQRHLLMMKKGKKIE